MFKQIYTTKPQSLLLGLHPNLKMLSLTVNCTSSLHNFGCEPHRNSYLLRPRYSCIQFCHKIVGNEETLAKSRNFRSSFHLKNGFENYPLRCFSSSQAQKLSEGHDGMANDSGKALPWLAKSQAREGKRYGEEVKTKGNRSSWEQSAEKFVRGGVSGLERKEIKSVEMQKNDYRYKNGVSNSGNREIKSFEMQKIDYRAKHGVSGSRSRGLKSTGKQKTDYRDVENDYLEEEEEEEEEKGSFESVDDPRWYKIKNRFDRIVDAERGSDGPEFRRWNKQENWGKKTWKEATESTVPNMIGEGIYGVGPALAALSAGRREFYALYVQEGLDLSSNNRKKKDRKAFEKVLKISEKIGLSKKMVSKHDLNMVVENRPHQGLVLDVSPLEMVGIKELDPVSVDGEKGPLWVALDEVTDPQNLGAIIRSAYFFGVLGVVLCAKNSAPLSGVVSKSSAGSLELMEIRSCKNMMQFLTSSAENGWRILGGSVSSRAVPLSEVLPGEPTILVLGSEGTGLRPLVERSCTQLVRIPGNIPVDVIAGRAEDVKTNEMDPRCSAQEFQSFMAVESLNVSVAAGVLLHHLIGSHYNNASHLQEKQSNLIE